MIVNLNMILALLWSFPLVLTFIKATPTPGGKSFDELLDAFKVTETNRAAGIQRAIKLAEDRNQNMTVKFLGIVGEANEILVKIREFFDAGRVLLNYKRGTATIPESEITAPASAPAPTPTSNQQNKRFDKLLNIFKSVETNRKTTMKEAKEAVSNHKNYDTEKFLGIVGETDEILVNLRRFFDAGKVMFDAYKRRLTSGEQDEEAFQKTKLLREENYFNNQMQRLAAMYSLLEEQMRLLSNEELKKLRPVIDIISRSEQELAPLATQFKIDMDKMEKAPKKS
ncbi:unnamed protein product [Bemisia tabaci]|uniref:Uncharacterized protein n=1 Tax=Bemisia tabaci TaxID=7038 RepID=A0A9P0APD5_BEMTA|nr:unnamed protein product [Bemisia tabaci]